MNRAFVLQALRLQGDISRRNLLTEAIRREEGKKKTRRKRRPSVNRNG